MNDINDYLKNLAISLSATSAKQEAAVAKALEEAENNRKLEEINSPTNQHLRTLIQQSSLLLLLLLLLLFYYSMIVIIIINLIIIISLTISKWD